MFFIQAAGLLLLVGGAIAATEKFYVDIEEKGWQFTETIELDEETNTEIFEVPHHNEVAATRFIHDFNTNLTLRIIRETGECFMSDLSELRQKGYIGPPEELKVHLRAAQIMEQNGAQSSAENVLQDLAIGRVLNQEELASLSAKHREACPDKPIHWLYKLQDTATVRQDEHSEHNYTDHALSRQKRDTYTPHCLRSNMKYRCRKQIHNCGYVYYGISTGTYFETCNAEAMRHSTRTRARCHDKSLRHVIDQVICCKECCTNRNQADQFFPHCGDLTNFDCRDPNSHGPK